MSRNVESIFSVGDKVCVKTKEATVRYYSAVPNQFTLTGTYQNGAILSFVLPADIHPFNTESKKGAVLPKLIPKKVPEEVLEKDFKDKKSIPTYHVKMNGCYYVANLTSNFEETGQYLWVPAFVTYKHNPQPITAVAEMSFQRQQPGDSWKDQIIDQKDMVYYVDRIFYIDPYDEDAEVERVTTIPKTLTHDYTVVVRCPYTYIPFQLKASILIKH